ncbi:MAG: hypothetical protein J6M43_03730 [Neisseriaceae bacterium]|nr:hypothetical protein [Neisseriaceae bacterium]
MILSVKKWLVAGVIGAFSLTSLTGCVISDDPYVNTAATAVATAGVVSLLLHSAHDNRYYDQSYRPMPRHYRPAHNARVVHVHNIHDYRRSHHSPRHYSSYGRGHYYR